MVVVVGAGGGVLSGWLAGLSPWVGYHCERISLLYVADGKIHSDESMFILWLLTRCIDVV